MTANVRKEPKGSLKENGALKAAVASAGENATLNQADVEPHPAVGV